MAPPPCRQLGRHCVALDVTLRVAALEGGEDHDATWLFGHTERISFGATHEDDGELWCRATVHVPCRHLEADDATGTARCAAHGFRGTVPNVRRRPQPRRLGGDRFVVVDRKRLVARTLPPKGRRPLPMAAGSNPCAEARCQTSDHTLHAACCRDLQTEIRCSRRQPLLEALIRNRKSPYLCRVEREEDHVLVVELLSACGYLGDDGIACALHGRVRPDGRAAKPLLCSEWPEKRSGLHVGCAFRNRRLKL